MYKTREAQKTFLRVVPNKNFLTPQIIGYYESNSGDVICELSRGEDMDRKRVYGVTVLEKKNEEFDHVNSLSQLFFSYKEARRHMKTVCSQKTK